MEIWKISIDQGEQSHSSLCIGIDHGGILAPCSNTSVGYCLFGQRYSRTSIQIDDSAPHFLFTQTAASGVGAVIKIHYYYGVLVISSTQSVDCAFRP